MSILRQSITDECNEFYRQIIPRYFVRATICSVGSLTGRLRRNIGAGDEHESPNSVFFSWGFNQILYRNGSSYCFEKRIIKINIIQTR